MRLIPSARCCECDPAAEMQPCVAIGSETKETFALICEAHAKVAFEHTASANGTKFSMTIRRANGTRFTSRSTR